MRWGTSPVARVDGSALQQLPHPFSLTRRQRKLHALEKRGHVRGLTNCFEEAFGKRFRFWHTDIFCRDYDNFGPRIEGVCVTYVWFDRCAGQETTPRPPKPACGTTTSALTRGSTRMLGFRLVDLCCRRGSAIARTSAAAGLALTLAGALAPAGGSAAGPAAAG